MSGDNIPRANLSEIIVDKLRQDINTGRLKPGEKLPPHEVLCKRWGVSRVTVREALLKLNGLGLVEMQQGRGTFIRAIDLSLLRERLQFHLVLDQKTVMQLLEARAIIESALAGLAAERGSEEHFANLEKLIQQMTVCTQEEDSLSYAVVDFSFHNAIAQAARNEILNFMLDRIHDFMETQQKNMFAYSDSQGIDLLHLTLQDHQEIYASIRNRSRKEAAEKMNQHICRVQSVIESYYRHHGANNA